jgi:hypothetical protein
VRRRGPRFLQFLIPQDVEYRNARTYELLGDPDKAIDYLEPILNVPAWLTPGRLKVDGNFAALPGRHRPRSGELSAVPRVVEGCGPGPSAHRR